MIIFGVAGQMRGGACGKLPSVGMPSRLETACQEPAGHLRGAMHSGPVISGFEGQPASELALREAAAVFAPRWAVVVVVWEAGRAFEAATIPAKSSDMRPADLDIRTAFDMEKAAYHTAQRLAEQGAAMARQAGLKADGLAVADDVTVAETIAGWPANSTEQAVVLGNHGHGELRRLVLEAREHLERRIARGTTPGPGWRLGA